MSRRDCCRRRAPLRAHHAEERSAAHRQPALSRSTRPRSNSTRSRCAISNWSSRSFAGQDDRATLFHTLDACRTPMGKRLLRATILRPLIDAAAIEARYEAVAEAHADLLRREEIRRAFAGILDLERLLARISLDSAGPRDRARPGRQPGAPARAESRARRHERAAAGVSCAARLDHARRRNRAHCSARWSPSLR